MTLPPINVTGSPAPDSVKPELVPATVRGWQVGQILNATVTARPNSQTATLRFGATDVELQTRIPLAPGDLVKVRVANAGERITLRLLNSDATADPTRSEAMRTALPRQQSLTGLLANLGQLLTAKSTTATQPRTSSSHPTLPPLPTQIRELARQLLQQLPDAQRAISNEGIKQAIRNSGTFTETQLAQAAQRGEAPPPGDTKLNLVRLLTALQSMVQDLPKPAEPMRPLSPQTAQLPPPLPHQSPVAQPRVPPTIVQLLDENISVVRVLQELLAQTEGALARIQVSQLASLGAQDTPTQVWIAEVPLRLGQQTDLIQFRIEHHRGGGARADEYWSITFAFELDELGPVRARVVFFQEELSATLWAERESTAKKFKNRLDELRKRIEQRGLKVTAVDCHTGIPVDDAAPTADTQLISEKV